MKKIYVAFTLLLVTTSLFAQVPYRHLFGAITGAEIQQMKASRLPSLNTPNRDLYQMYVDYSASDFDDLYYVWKFNSDYTGIDTATNYAAVVLNNLVGYTDPADPVTTYVDWTSFSLPDSFPSYIGFRVTIDSIYVQLSHENNTGQLDTFVLKIVKTLTTGTTKGYPSTVPADILWQERDSVDFGFSSTNNWLGTGAGVVLGFGPEYALPAGLKTATVFEYYNKNKLDTLGMAAGSVDDGSGLGTSITKSAYHTSYMRYPPFINNISRNANIYYDGNGNGNYDPGENVFEAQNWLFIFLVTINTETGINDNFGNLTVAGVSPNPAGGATNVLYSLKQAGDVKINLLDLGGKMIRQLYSGNDGAGSRIRNIDLGNVNSGIYFVSVQAGNGTPVVSKLVVSK